MTTYYNNFINLITIKKLNMQYVTMGSHYCLFAYEGNAPYYCVILDESDINDFETKYKSNCNLQSPDKVQILNQDNEISRFAFNSSDDLKVSLDGIPEGRIEVIIEVVDNVEGTSYVDTSYLIPTGKKLTIIIFECGANGSSYNGASYASKGSLYYCPDGVINSNSIILGLGYVASGNYQKYLHRTYIGDGVKKIIIRRERQDGVSREIYASWMGYTN